MRQEGNKKGFTLVEIMIVAAIVGIVSSIAIPSFNKVRTDTRAKACLNNLRQMETAKQQAAMDNGWGENDGPGTIGNPYYRNTCSSYIKGGERPVCPTGANCYYNALNQAATCESGIASHVLD